MDTEHSSEPANEAISFELPTGYDRDAYERELERAARLDIKPQWERDAEALATNLAMEKCDLQRERRDIEWNKPSSTSLPPGELIFLWEYFVIRSYGGKARVALFSSRGELVTMSFEEFRNAHIEKEWTDPNNPSKRARLVDVWLRHESTKRYDRVEFRPGTKQEAMPSGVLNLWRGWPYGMVPGTDGADDWFDGPEEPSECFLFLEHIRCNICGCNEELYQYVLTYIANLLNNPGPCETVLVLRGPQGSGKTFFAERLMDLFGIHAITLDDEQQVVGNFNKHLMHQQLVFLDEAFFAGNRKHAAKMKTLSSRPDIFIEPKGVDGFVVPKWFSLIIASNEEQVVRAEGDDRRYLVLDCDACENNQNREYFAEMQEEFEDFCGRSSLFRWMTGKYWREKVANGAFRRMKRPVTEALQEQKDLSLSEVEDAIFTMLREGEPPCDYRVEGSGVLVPTNLLVDAARLNSRDRKKVGMLLRMLAAGDEGRAYFGSGKYSKQMRGWRLPSLAECRARWEAHLGRKVVWPEGVVSWALQGECETEKDRDGRS